MSFTRLPHTDEADWLAQRAEHITATEVAQLEKSNSAFRRIAAEKEFGSSFTGNRYTEWGKQQEPVIAEYLSHFGPDTSLEPNDDLMVMDGTRYAATPDMINPQGDTIGEIKTTGDDTGWSDGNIPAHYLAQVHWQLMVTGAEACVFAWQVRGVDEMGEFYPEGDIHHLIIKPDLEHEKKLRALADLFLAGDHPEPLAPDGLEQLVVERQDLEVQLAGVKQSIEELVGTEPATYDLPTATVTVTADGKSTRLDTKALAADHPEITAHYETTVARKGSVRIRNKKEAG